MKPNLQARMKELYESLTPIGNPVDNRDFIAFSGYDDNKAAYVIGRADGTVLKELSVPYSGKEEDLTSALNNLTRKVLEDPLR